MYINDEYDNVKDDINIGDLVEIDGLGNEKYIIFAITTTYEVDAHRDYYDMWIDVASVNYKTKDRGEVFIYASVEDVVNVYKEEVINYDELEELLTMSDEVSQEVMETVMFSSHLDFETNKDVIMSNRTTINPTHRQDDETTAIDRALDEINDWNYLIKMFGDEDNVYQDHVDRIVLRLKRNTKGSDK